MKRYKFQALLKLSPVDGGNPGPELGSSPRRMVVRADDGDARHSRLFTALISSDGEMSAWSGSKRQMVTLRVTGDDVCEVLDIGSRFRLWLGDDVAEGVVTRRLFTWPT